MGGTAFVHGSHRLSISARLLSEDDNDCMMGDDDDGTDTAMMRRKISARLWMWGTYYSSIAVQSTMPGEHEHGGQDRERDKCRTQTHVIPQRDPVLVSRSQELG